MNTKTFAQTARRILMDGVTQKLLYWGFAPEGEVAEEPVKVEGGYTFRGKVYDNETVPALWQKLKSAIRKKGIEVIVEEAAYTWFNRIMALRIMAKNDYEEPQLSYVEGMEHTPYILQRARQGEYSFLNNEEQRRLRKLISDYNKDAESFALLLVGYCHHHKTLNNIFGKLDDYTELLLPDNMLQENGFLHLLNNTDAISDEDYKKVELIGWLYQFYISERKDEVFASFKKNKKAEAKDIPAATQIFTPNWIVKYMVENTAGKLWLDYKPDSSLRDKMKYLVLSEQGTENREKRDVNSNSSLTPHPSSLSPSPSPLITNIEDLTLIDPACGSGHILVEGFDLLYQMYMEEYYTPEEAVETILAKNLYGLDIDDRAVQLATFAILLKAAQQYRDVFSKGWMPQVYAMPEAQDFTRQEVLDFLGADGEAYAEELCEALLLMKQAKNLGSVMKLSLSEDARNFIEERFKQLVTLGSTDFNVIAVFQKIKPFIPILLLLTKKYTAVVANPPYMGQKSMNAPLKSYLNANYPISKSDLFAVFIEAMINMLQENARVGCITMESWMFLSSYEKLRNKILNNYSIASLAHFGWHIIGIAFGTAALILENSKKITKGEYSYLTIDDIDREKNIPFVFPKKDNGRYAQIPQTNFEKIPGSPIAYWVSEVTIKHFENEKRISDYLDSAGRIKTHNNNKYLRIFWEVSKNQIGSTLRWKFVENGGEKRKWYGNRETIVDWSKDAITFYDTHGGLSNPKFLEKKGLSWAIISSNGASFRYKDEFAEYTSASPTLIPKKDKEELIEYCLGFLNTKYVFNLLKVLNPTINTTSGVVNSLPFKFSLVFKSKVNLIVKYLINLSKKDWDSRETSWDFEQNPLFLSDQELGIRDENSLLSTRPSSLSEAYECWEKDVTKDFFQLHQNEEELNRIFIDIYGLQDELTPDVALKDITILQDELDRKQLEQDEKVLREQGLGISRKDKGLPLVPENYKLPIDKAEVMRQFISYCVGVFMGRYRLDKSGLHIAHPNPSQAELEEYLVISGKGLGPDTQQEIFKYIHHEHKEFSRSSGLAKIHHFGNTDLSNQSEISKGGALRAEQSVAQSSSLSAQQYSRGASEGNEGVSALSENSQGLTGRSGNTTGDSLQLELSEPGSAEPTIGTNNGNQQNAERINEESNPSSLTPTPYSLSPSHLSLINELIANPSTLTSVQIDEDAILPLMGNNCNFHDDVVLRIHHLLDVIWGHEVRTENLNFIQKCLNQDLDKFLVKDFYKYHCKMYKKKPIYWLFSSKKGAFQVLVYMHRMNEFTAEKIRANYLLEHLKNLRAEEAMLKSNESGLNTQEARKLEQLRKDIHECEIYDMELKEVADQQIKFDLDDGVTVNYKLFEKVVATIK